MRRRKRKGRLGQLIVQRRNRGLEFLPHQSLYFRRVSAHLNFEEHIS